MTDAPLANRRPLATRSTAGARWLAGALLRSRITPDQISAAGIAFAGLAALAFWAAPTTPAAWLAAAAFIQLRLLANLLDGMVAVEGGRASPLGPLWNEAPDRIEDIAILAGFGYAASAPTLGLCAALAAVLCAYVRVLGGALGQPQSFAGPMAKQHRMAAVTFGCVAAFLAALAGSGAWVAEAVLWVVTLGAALTALRRLLALAALMRNP